MHTNATSMRVRERFDLEEEVRTNNSDENSNTKESGNDNRE